MDNSKITSFLLPRPDYVKRSNVTRRITNLVQQINPSHGRSPVQNKQAQYKSNTMYSFSGYQQPSFGVSTNTYIPSQFRQSVSRSKNQKVETRQSNWQILEYTGTIQDFLKKQSKR
ncbi:hypothetical protein AKO1_000263 [Acrasis kona]|uniref:Uncharacterized protein n=1 Tax=Acrasis kona TaxID=1008807 RepID=A0AAW2ZG20_9EUKA